MSNTNKNTVEIEKSSEYNARATKKTDLKNKILGYDFSYPVINTVEIVNLFLSGCSTDICFKGQEKSTWAFDLTKSILSIEQKSEKKEYYIYDVEELGEAMLEYFDNNKGDIRNKNLEASLNESKSKLGNKNAVKNRSCNTLDKEEDVKKEKALQNLSPDEKRFKECDLKIPTEFCSYHNRPMSLEKPGDYYGWIKKNNFWEELSEEDKNRATKVFDIKPPYKR